MRNRTLLRGEPLPSATASCLCRHVAATTGYTWSTQPRLRSAHAERTKQINGHGKFTTHEILEDTKTLYMQTVQLSLAHVARQRPRHARTKCARLINAGDVRAMTSLRSEVTARCGLDKCTVYSHKALCSQPKSRSTQSNCFATEIAALSHKL